MSIAVIADLDIDASERMQDLARITRALSGIGPHISLTDFHRDPPLEAVSPMLAAFAQRAPALPVRLDSLGVFGSEAAGFVLFLAPVVTEDLLALHRHCHEVLADYAADAVDYYRPGQWVPHVTVAAGLDGLQLAARLADVARSFTPFSARLGAISLVEHPPARVLGHWPLGG